MACECSVCYSDLRSSACKLTCGHSFCNGCIKSWYLKGANGSACPMCRRPIYFSGFHKVRESWDGEAWETKCTEIYGEALDQLFEEAQDFAETFGPKWKARIFRDLIEDFKDLDRTLRALRAYNAPLEAIEDAIYNDDYYSDRHLNKWEWDDEPVKELALRYPGKAGAAGRCGKRGRALEDEWATLNFVIEF